MKEYVRNCPNCEKEIFYAKKSYLNDAIKRNKPCISCSQKRREFKNKAKDNNFTRICPSCKNTIVYTKYGSFYSAELKKCVCKKCFHTKLGLLKRKEKTLDRWFKKRVNVIKLKCKTQNLKFDIDVDYLINLYEKQRGRCFYTDIEILPYSENKKHSISIDKIVPDRGYTKGNIVLCLNRINLIKNDMTLEEMRKWTPDWYSRIVKEFGEIE